MISDKQLDKYISSCNALGLPNKSRDEAHEQAMKLIQLVELMYKPISKEALREAEIQIWAPQAEQYMSDNS